MTAPACRGTVPESPQSTRADIHDLTQPVDREGPELFFNLGNRSLEQGAYVRQFHYRESVRPAEVELKDYSFKTPAYSLSQKKMGSGLGHINIRCGPYV